MIKHKTPLTYLLFAACMLQATAAQSNEGPIEADATTTTDSTMSFFKEEEHIRCGRIDKEVDEEIEKFRKANSNPQKLFNEALSGLNKIPKGIENESYNQTLKIAKIKFFKERAKSYKPSHDMHIARAYIQTYCIEKAKPYLESAERETKNNPKAIDDILETYKMRNDKKLEMQRMAAIIKSHEELEMEMKKKDEKIKELEASSKEQNEKIESLKSNLEKVETEVDTIKQNQASTKPTKK